MPDNRSELDKSNALVIQLRLLKGPCDGFCLWEKNRENQDTKTLCDCHGIGLSRHIKWANDDLQNEDRRVCFSQTLFYIVVSWNIWKQCDQISLSRT